VTPAHRLVLVWASRQALPFSIYSSVWLVVVLLLVRCRRCIIQGGDRARHGFLKRVLERFLNAHFLAGLLFCVDPAMGCCCVSFQALPWQMVPACVCQQSLNGDATVIEAEVDGFYWPDSWP